jgi:hypothetical protein
MKLPFSTEDFLNVFGSYNQSVFPVQIIFYLIAIICIYLLVKGSASSNKIIASVLSFFWLWIGIIYHIVFFSSINKAAYFFGGLFIIQSILFFIDGVVQNKLSFAYTKNIFSNTGIIFLAYALIIYPLLGYLLGHKYPEAPTFGLPCPTTIFTFGILLFANKKFSILILIIPLLWSLIGFSAAFNLGIYEDYGLLIAGVLGFILLIINNKKMNLS